MFTVLLLLSFLLSTSSSHNLSYPHFQQLDVKQTLAQTKLIPTPTPNPKQPSNHHQTPNTVTDSSSTKGKLKLVHRDKVPTFNTSHDHQTRFNARIKRDSRRVAALLRRLASGKPTLDSEAFGSDVVIDSGSDIIWVRPMRTLHPMQPRGQRRLLLRSLLRRRVLHKKGTLILETLTLAIGHRNQGMFVGDAGLLGLQGGPMSYTKGGHYSDIFHIYRFPSDRAIE